MIDRLNLDVRTAAKRVIDVLAAAAGLSVAGPVVALLATAVALESPGNPFFGHERVGLHGRKFKVWKLRTMVPNANLGGEPITVGGDRRITKLGRLLRATKLDELPQLFNVLRGDMSLVGPRPEVPEFVARFAADYDQILSVRPGITDEASIRYRHEEDILQDQPDPIRYYEEVLLPRKIALAKDYVRRYSLTGDLAILVRTALVVLRG